MPTIKLVNAFPLRSISIGIALAAAMNFAAADEVIELQALMNAGKPTEALKKVDGLLANKPNDARLQLQRGIALAALNRQAEAITVFQKIIEVHPELPGPYNNIAVLYASQGDYDKARQALELAIRTNPSYSTAFQNLGDVYARLAGQAYKKALTLDKSDNKLPLKLAVVQNVFEGSVDPRTGKPVGQAPAPTPVAVASASPVPAPAPVAAPALAPAPAPLNKTAAPAPAPVPAPTPMAKAPAAPAPAPAPSPLTAKTPSPAPAPVVAAAPAATPAPTPVKAAATPAPAPTPAAQAAAPAPKPEPARVADSSDADKQAIEKALQTWTQAWSQRDMAGYYAAYTSDFKGKSPTHKAWEEERRARITSKKKIAVNLSNVRIKVQGDKATVTFRQDYTSDALNVKSSKTLEMVKGKSGNWVIAQESAS